MSRKRIRTSNTGEAGGGVIVLPPPESEADIVWDTAVDLLDVPAPGPALPDLFEVVDQQQPNPMLPSTPTLLDARESSVPSAMSQKASTLDLKESHLRASLSSFRAGRSGTPDSDMITDGWTDQASTGTNHGNENLLVKGKSTLANDERRAFILIDARRWKGLPAQNGACSLFIEASVTGILNTTVQYRYLGTNTRPFTESTLDWSNQPNATDGTGSFSVLTGAARDYSLGIDSAMYGEIATFDWFLFMFTCATAAVPPTVTITSRDANSATAPRLTLAAQKIY